MLFIRLFNFIEKVGVAGADLRILWGGGGGLGRNFQGG